MGVPPSAGGSRPSHREHSVDSADHAGGPWTLAAVPSLRVLAGLALLSTALAYVLNFRVLASAGATNLLLVTLLIPVTAILLGAAFLQELLAPHHIARIALIGIGLAAVGQPHHGRSTAREIAAGLHNCAPGSGLLGCPGTREFEPKE
jgi:hypothetical protein